MSKLELLTDRLELRTVTAAPDFDRVRVLLREYNDFLFTIIEPSLLRHRLDELDSLADAFSPPRGILLLAAWEGRAVGCFGLRPLASDRKRDDGEPAAECCRLWVTRAARGRYLGRILTQAAIEIARTQGFAALYLNSVPEHMATAYHLYLHLGFQQTTAYKSVPIPGVQFLRLGLDQRHRSGKA